MKLIQVFSKFKLPETFSNIQQLLTLRCFSIRSSSAKNSLPQETGIFYTHCTEQYIHYMYYVSVPYQYLQVNMYICTNRTMQFVDTVNPELKSCLYADRAWSCKESLKNYAKSSFIFFYSQKGSSLFLIWEIRKGGVLLFQQSR